MIKLVACDLDGTILDKHKNPDPKLKETIEKLRKHNIDFTIISGRNEEIMHQYVDFYDVKIPYVTNNGGNVYHNHVCLYNDCIPQIYNNTIASLLYENDVAFRMFTTTNVFGHSVTDFFIERMVNFDPIKIDYNPSIDISNQQIYKITCDFNKHKEIIPRFLEEINQKCPNVNFLRAETYVYCANSLTATKGNALKKVCELINIDMSEVIAFGDNGNDVSMLKGVGVSVSMGNAQDDIKQLCDYVCEDNEHSGVARFLEEYFKDIL